MATPAMTASTRFFHAGKTKVYYLPTVSATSLTPTRSEMNAGTDLSGEIAEINGWNVSSGEIPTPDLATTYDSKIPGRTSSDDSSITFYQSRDGVDVRALLPRDTAGYILILDGGDTAAYKADCFKIKVRSNAKQRSIGDEAARIQVQFSITALPGENVTVPS